MSHRDSTERRDERESRDRRQQEPMEYATDTAIGEHKDRTGGINEDSTAVVPIERVHRDERQTASVLVLADGAGGHDAGDVASYVATNHVARELSDVAHAWLGGATGGLDVDVRDDGTPSLDTEIERAVERAITGAHERILEVAEREDQTLYTTVVAGVVLGEKLYYGWVGDSRAYLANERHESIRLLTRDHSQVADWERDGKVDAVEAAVHPQGNVVTRVAGGQPGTDGGTFGVETGSVDLYAEDVILFTSDGLIDAHALDNRQLFSAYQSATDKSDAIEEIKSRVVTDDEIRDVVLGADSLSAAVRSLTALGNDRGGKDNMSFVLARHGDRPDAPDDPPGRGFEPTFADEFEKAGLERSETRIDPADDEDES